MELEGDPGSNKTCFVLRGSSALVLSENQPCRTSKQYRKGLLNKNQEREMLWHKLQ